MKQLVKRNAPLAETLRVLSLYVGKTVCVQNNAEFLSDSEVKPEMSITGELELPTSHVDEERNLCAHDRWYVRIGECYHGPLGYGFTACHVLELCEHIDGTLLIVVL